jgi:heme A synthase
MKLSRFAKFAWFVLFYNVVVVVWGVFLRASKSGDGCGKYWLTCHGEVIPSAPQLKTLIEFSHRVMSGVDFLLVLALLVVVVLYYRPQRQLKFFAILSFVFIVTEALIGAGLVLTGNVAGAHTDSRPLWAIGHLINTFLLLGSLSLTAWIAGSGKTLLKPRKGSVYLFAGIGTALILFVGMTGSIAALTNMLFPSESVIAGIIKDFSPDSHYLLRIRILHPIGAVLAAVFVGFVAARLRETVTSSSVKLWSGVLMGLIVCQLIFGAVTLLTGGPIVMQLIHLLLADAVWISWVLMFAGVLGSEDARA